MDLNETDACIFWLQHMVLGGLPLLVISILNHDNAVSGNLGEFSTNDLLALLYTSIFGSAVSYGVFFYSATKGIVFCFHLSVIKLSSFHFANFSL